MGSLTSPESRLLLIGNPTRQSGEFYNAFHSARVVLQHDPDLRPSTVRRSRGSGFRAPSAVVSSRSGGSRR